MRPATLVAIAAVTLASAALAEEWEVPTTFKAAGLLAPAEKQGPHHTVEDQVPTESFYHSFKILSDFGELPAEGLSVLRVRVAEVGALAELQEISKTEVALQAVGRSLESAGQGVVAAVKDPAATAKGVGKGVKRFGVNLGRKAKRAAQDATDDDAQKKEDKSTEEKAETVANAALGVNKAARIWAQKLQVDPYTTNPVLAKTLLEVGKVDAAAGVATKIVVPVPKVVSLTSSVGNLVWGQDPEALRKTNESRLKELGVSEKVAGGLFQNGWFALTYQTRLIAALHAVKTKGLADYVDTARDARSERQAFFFVESAEMLQGQHARAPVEQVLLDSRAMVAKTADGTAIALLPLDYVAWTEAVEQPAKEIAARAKKELGAAKLEMHLTGQASPRARKELEALGWSVRERVSGTSARGVSN